MRAAKPKAIAGPAATALPEDRPQPETVSPYQKPPKVAGINALSTGEPPIDIGEARPSLKRRKTHSEPPDPYAALGVRAGAFTLYPAIELTGGYDTNAAQAAGGAAAKLYTVAPELQAQSNWLRHELKADLRGSYTGYSPDQTPTLSRSAFNGKIDGRVDVTKFTRIDLGARALVSADNPSSPNLTAGLAKLPLFVTGGGDVGLGQRFNRFDISVKGDFERTTYQNSKLTDGTAASNADRNFDQYSGTFRAGYELTPGLMPFAEIVTDRRKHDLMVDSFGYARDSKGLTGKLGSTFELTRLLTGEFSAGYLRRRYEDTRLNDVKGLVADASLIWSADALTAVKFTAKTTIAESTIPGVSGVPSYDVGVQVDHSFQRWLIGTAKFGFGTDSYKGANVDILTTPLNTDVVSTLGGTAADRVDRRYSAGLALTYKLNPYAQIKGEFRQDWLHSNISSNDYTASLFLIGLRLQQ